MIGLFQLPPEGVAYISIQDPALDLERCDIQQYLTTFDPVHQPTLEGKTPTRFWLRRLSKKQWEAVNALPQSLQFQQAVSYSLVKLENFVTRKGYASVVHVGQGNELRCDHDTLESIYSPPLFVELSKVIVQLSNLDPLAGAR